MKSEKIDILGFCYKTKNKLWKMKVIVIPIVVSLLGTALKRLEKYRRNWKSEESRLYKPQHR